MHKDKLSLWSETWVPVQFPYFHSSINCGCQHLEHTQTGQSAGEALNIAAGTQHSMLDTLEGRSTCKCSFYCYLWNWLHFGHSNSIFWLYLVNTSKLVSKDSAFSCMLRHKAGFCPAISSVAVSLLLRVSGNPATHWPVINAYFAQIIYSYYAIWLVENIPILLLTKEIDC